jgi:hypothetical protein
MDDETYVAQLERVWRAHVRGDPRELLKQWRERQPDAEHRLTMPTPQAKQLLALVCERFGLSPYRRRRQRATTVCLDAPPGFVDEVFAPLFEPMVGIIDEVAAQVTTRIMERWSRGDGATRS